MAIQAEQRSSVRGPDPGRVPAPSAVNQILRQAKHAFACDAVTVFGWSSGGAVELVASSEPSARRADQLQVGHGEGPALSVRDGADVCLSGDTRADQRWRRWGPAVAELGWLSVLSAPLATPGQVLGVVTLYSRRVAAFDATHAYAARIFAQYAANLLICPTEAEGLRDAVVSRHRIGLAQDLLMEQHGLAPEEAFDLLRRHSQAHDLKLHTVAEQVLRTGTIPTASRGRHRPTSAA